MLFFESLVRFGLTMKKASILLVFIATILYPRHDTLSVNIVDKRFKHLRENYSDDIQDNTFTTNQYLGSNTHHRKESLCKEIFTASDYWIYH